MKTRTPYLLLLLIAASFFACDRPKEEATTNNSEAEAGLKGTGEAVSEVLQRESRRTNSDYVAYIPGSFDYTTSDSHNEHFLVFNGPDKSMMAVWTQTVCHDKNGNRNRIVFSRSTDQGVTWASPTHLVGPKNCADSTHIASWAFPLVSKSGRIYVIFNRNIGVKGWIYFHTGIMQGMYSDDNGVTWSEPQQIPMPLSIYDDPEGKIPSEWIVWQLPEKDLKGNYFIGYSRWVNPARARLKKTEGWTSIESVVEFMRFTNIDQNPEPADVKIEYSAWGEKALRVPHREFPTMSVAQEPSIVRLPDNRLLCAMRTNSGYLWYSLSNDDGRTWCNPRPLLRKDFGEPILQPVSCAPIYRLHDGRYVLFHHNNSGDPELRFVGPRYPAFVALGEFRPNADQPLWFSESKELMNSDGFGPDGVKSNRVNNVAVYTSFTTNDGNNVLWHPDRKFYLLGKKITAEFLSDLKVPADDR